MRAFAVPSGGLLFPQYFDNGNAAFLDTTLSWNELAVQFPSEYCHLDSTGFNPLCRKFGKHAHSLSLP